MTVFSLMLMTVICGMCGFVFESNWMWFLAVVYGIAFLKVATNGTD